MVEDGGIFEVFVDQIEG